MTLIQRMNAVMTAAVFTISDMALWFEADRSAMRKWLVDKVEPRDIRKKPLEDNCRLLERALKNAKLKKMLPVPMSVNQYERKEYIAGVKGHAITEFSKTRPAK